MSILEWLALAPLAFVIYAIVSFLYLRTPNPPPAPVEEAAWPKRSTASSGKIDIFPFLFLLPIVVAAIYVFEYIFS